MRRFVEKQPGKGIGKKQQLAADLLGGEWSVRNVRKAMAHGEDDWLPRAEKIFAFCEVADVSLDALVLRKPDTSLQARVGDYVREELERRLRFEGFEVEGWRILAEAVEREERSVAARYAWLLGPRSLRGLDEEQATHIPGFTPSELEIVSRVLRDHIEGRTRTDPQLVGKSRGAT
jgi:hypothetical protein